MTLKFFLKNHIKPFVKENDKPFNRQLFNDTKDLFFKEGLISNRQVNTWIYPSNIGKAKFI